MNQNIVSKLKITSYASKLLLGKPKDIDDFDGMAFDTKATKEKYDLIFVFIFSIDEFKNCVQEVIDKKLLNPNGYLYFAYPKKGNKQYAQHIGRDDFFTPVAMDKDGYINGSPLKFNKMVAFNSVFTAIGLKHQAKRKDKSLQPSQCVADYVDRIPDLQKHFARNKKVLDFYNGLTPGYQRDWARYVYSAKTQATINKRLAEMESILGQGYKTIDLYRQAKKK